MTPLDNAIGANGVEFDAESHTYRLNGRVLPSVTEVIRAVLPGWEASQWHMDRGSAVHLACRYLDEGRLEWESVDESIVGRVKAWQAFREQYGGTVEACELSMAHERLRFAGTTDRVLSDGRGEYMLVDLKNSLSPQVIPQLGGYSLLWNADKSRPKVRRAVAVELGEGGGFRTEWLSFDKMRNAEGYFLAALTVFNFCKHFKLKREA